MNIAFLSIGSLKNPRESARITLLLLAKELKQKGHTVIIFARTSKSLPAHEMIEGLPIHRTALLHIPNAVRKHQQTQAFDVIHSFSATPLFAVISRLSRVNAKTKLIHTIKSYSKHKSANWYFLLRLMDYVTVPTRAHAQKINLNQPLLRVIPSPIDLTKFTPANKRYLKKKYGYDNKKVLLYYGALWPGKGVEIVIPTLPFLISKFPTLKLIIAPRYPNISSQKELIKKLNVEDYVDFVIEPLLIEEYVALADGVVLPYLNLQGTEGNPSCLLEAMACKTAVVTSDLPELREIAEGCVRFALPGNVTSLAEKVREALEYPHSSMVEKAFLVSKEFDVKKIAENFLRIYKL